MEGSLILSPLVPSPCIWLFELQLAQLLMLAVVYSSLQILEKYFCYTKVAPALIPSPSLHRTPPIPKPTNRNFETPVKRRNVEVYRGMVKAKHKQLKKGTRLKTGKWKRRMRSDRPWTFMIGLIKEEGRFDKVLVQLSEPLAMISSRSTGKQISKGRSGSTRFSWRCS
jgi:hypothetical protein